MATPTPSYKDLISGVSTEAWKAELEKTSFDYHMRVLWVATVFNPIFAVTDYVNIHDHWILLLVIRLAVSFITLIMFAVRKKYGLPSRVNIAVTFLLISFQNALVFAFVDHQHLVGQNLNYTVLFVGASMFILWESIYSVLIVLASAIATFFFIELNPTLEIGQFLVKGGLLLIAVSVFMIILVRTRYELFIKEIKSRLALKASYDALEAQDEEIRSINENLEKLVRHRTMELMKKNQALEEYAFINAHKLRAPVASILGLLNLLRSLPLEEDVKHVVAHLEDSTKKLDEIVASITQAIERADE